MTRPEPLAEAHSSLVVRPARDDDMGAVARIYGYHVRHGLASFEETAPDCDELMRRRAEVSARGLPYLVAEREGRILGFAYASAYRPRPGYRHTVEDSVYVDESALRQGIGRALLSRVIARCTELGYRQMVAVIGDSGNVSSIGAHLALGFREAGRLQAVGYKHGRWVDVVLMQRALGRGQSAPPERP